MARRVVLHLDLNRTVLMSDAAGGRSMENTVDYLLSECSWGFEDASKWVCVSERSTIEPPPAPEGRTLVSYKQFVDDAHPYKSLAAAEGGASIEDVKAFNKAAKKKRTALQSAFTGGEDAPGARVRASFDEVMKKLHFPEGAERDAAVKLAQTLPKSRLQEAYAEGRYYLLPSFINLLFHLAEDPRAENVKLVFRTFGDDIPEVAAELELLTEGKHPLAPGKKLHESFKLDVEPGCRSIATFYRDGFDANGSVLTVGSLTKVPFSSASQGDAYAAHDFYASLPNAPSVEVNRGFEPIKALIDRMLRDSRTIALRDYWEWWSAHAENGEYGKLLLVSTQPNAEELSVFFDDHIEAHHSHIVDVRDLATGEPVSFEQSKGKYLQRVEPFSAITDPNYFVSLFEQIIARS